MERQLLQRRFTPERVRHHLIPRDAWRPFPAASERAPWEALPAWVRDATLRQAEARLGASWGALPATLFLEYRRQGNRARYEAVHHPRRTMLADLVLGECVEGRGRFLDAVIDGVWALLEESFWGVPAHSYSPRFPETGLPDTAYRVVDLFAAETGALLAWTYYLLGAPLGREVPVVPDRIVRDVHERILLPYRTIDDWRWLGKVRRPVNNWNPWIHSNVLACTLLLASDPLVREATVLCVIEGLDAFLDGYYADGGCDEGPGYWGRAGASLFDCLEWPRGGALS